MPRQFYMGKIPGLAHVIVALKEQVCCPVLVDKHVWVARFAGIPLAALAIRQKWLVEQAPPTPDLAKIEKCDNLGSFVSTIPG